MKRTLQKMFFTSVLLLSMQHFASAQYFTAFNRKLEVGLNLGPSNFLGDLGGNSGIGKTFLKDNNVELTKIITGGYISYYPAEWLGFRLSGQYTRIEGDDGVINRRKGAEEARANRNLSFRSNIAELYVAAEFYPTVFFEHDDYVAGKLRPVLIAGIGMFKFNPQAQLNGEWIDLRPLRTEGQGFAQYPDRKPYSNTAFAFPVGVGLKYYASEKLTLGFEAIHRFTTTDYIDDVSTKYIDPTLFDANLTAPAAALAKQLHNRSLPGTYSDPALANNVGKIRGDSKENDGYYSFALKIGWRLGSEEQSEWRRIRKQSRCYY
jgi:Domain of unknown function (DUF6089)